MSQAWETATPSRPRPAGALDRLPPHSLEAEQGVLGCILIDPAKSREIFQLAQEKIGADAFFDLRHREIWNVIAALDGENSGVDLILVPERLRQLGKLEQAGGLAYLNECLDKVPSAANLPNYLNEVFDLWRKRRMISACVNSVGELYESAGPAGELLDRAEARVLAANTAPQESAIVSTAELMPRLIDKMEQAFDHRNQGIALGHPTGFTYLDKKICGLENGVLYVIGGRPSTGKTAMLVTLLLHLAVKCKIPVGFVSVEMSAMEIGMRMLCQLAGANMMHLKSGMVTERDKQALADAAPLLSKAPIFIDDTPHCSPQQLRQRARRLVQRHEVKLLGADHLSMIRDPANRGDEQADAAAAVVSAKWCARAFGVPVVALAQLNRESEKEGFKREPRMSDLRASGVCEQEADFIGILYRDRRREEQQAEAGGWTGENERGEETSRLVTMEICKQRNGPIGPVWFEFLVREMKMVDGTRNTGSVASGQKKAAREGARKPAVDRVLPTQAEMGAWGA